MREQIAQHQLLRRASATQEELAARRTNSYQMANNHRAGHNAGIHPEDAPYVTGHVYEGYDDGMYDTRAPSSAIKYQTDFDGQVIRQGNRRIIIHNTPPPQRRKQEPEYDDKPPRKIHWLVFAGLAMFIMLVGWIALTAFTQWWQVQQDDWKYGRPRTYQIDAIVGHKDTITPSHFIAENLNRHIVVIEIPGGDTSQSQIYLGPILIGEGQDLLPVTLSFKDVNGDGKVDMLIHILDQTIVFINDGTKFRPLKPGEHVQL